MISTVHPPSAITIRSSFDYVGHTASFKAEEKRELYAMLEPMREGGPSFEGERQPGGQSRWSRAGRQQQEWVAIRPELVCEVSYDRM